MHTLSTALSCAVSLLVKACCKPCTTDLHGCDQCRFTTNKHFGLETIGQKLSHALPVEHICQVGLSLTQTRSALPPCCSIDVSCSSDWCSHSRQDLAHEPKRKPTYLQSMPISLACKLKDISSSRVVHHLIVGTPQLAQHPARVELRRAQLVESYCCLLRAHP